MATGRAIQEGKNRSAASLRKAAGRCWRTQAAAGCSTSCPSQRTECFPSAGKVAIPPRRSVDAARILCFKVEMITPLIACTAAGTVLRFISRPAPVVEKGGANRAMCPTKEKESEAY